MPVFRVEKTSNYTVMSNYHLKDKNLSLKAKGLLSVMLSYPDDWDYTQAGLAKLSKDGMDSIRSALNELEKHGYLSRRRLKDEQGHYTNTEYTVYEHSIHSDQARNREKAEKNQEKPSGKKEKTSMSENPRLEKPSLNNPITGKPRLDEPITEKPRLGEPISEKPTQEKPIQENPTLINTNKPNTNKPNTNLSSFGGKEKKDGRETNKNNTARNPQEELLLGLYGAEDEEMAYELGVKLFRERLDYPFLIGQHPEHKELVDGLISLIVNEVFLTRKKRIRIASDTRNTQNVKKTLLRLDCRHLQMIIQNLTRVQRASVDDKQYLMACLFNAPNTRQAKEMTWAAETANAKEGEVMTIESG